MESGGKGKAWWLHTYNVPGTKAGASAVIRSQLKCGETHAQRGWECVHGYTENKTSNYPSRGRI